MHSHPFKILLNFHYTIFLHLLCSQVDTYLQLKGTQLEREMAAEIILHILDKVMQNTQSLNSQQVSYEICEIIILISSQSQLSKEEDTSLAFPD